MKVNALFVLAALGCSVDARFLHGLNQLRDYNQQRQVEVATTLPTGTGIFPPTPTGTGVFPPPPTGTGSFPPPLNKKRGIWGAGDGDPQFPWPTGTGAFPPPPPPTGTGAFPPPPVQKRWIGGADNGQVEPSFPQPTGSAPTGSFPTDPWGPRPTGAGGQWRNAPRNVGRVPVGPAVPPPLP